MDATNSTSETFLRRLTRVGLPTLFLWLLTFEWIGRAHAGIQIATRVIFILLGLVWFILRSRQGDSFRITSIGILLLLYLGYLALLVPSAPLPFHSLELQISNIFYFLVFLFYLNDTRSQVSRNAWKFAFLQLAIIFSIFNIFLVARWLTAWLQINEKTFIFPLIGYRLPGLFLQHPNYEAAFLNLVIPFVLVEIFNSSERKIRYSLHIILLLFLATSFFASSRGAWLAMASIFCTVLLLHYWTSIKGSLQHFTKQRRLSISPGTIAILSVGFLLLGGAGYLSFLQARSGGHGGRLGIWMIAWDIFMDAPIQGHGPGSYHILSAVKAAIPQAFYQVHAHNLVLQVLGESGLIGFFLFSAIVIRTITLIIRGWRRSDQNKKDLIACTAVLVGMMTHHFVDFAFEAPLYNIGFFFVLANISQLEYPPMFSNNRSIAKKSLILVLIISYGIGSVFTLRGAQLQYHGALAAQAGNWERAQTYFCLAQKQNTRLSLFNFQCGFASAVLMEELDDSQFLSIASHAYQEGLGKDPYWPYHRAASASILWTLGAHEEALGMMLEAQSQAPRSFILALNLAWMHAEIGHADLSKSYLSLAYELNPWLWRNAQNPWKPTGEALDPANLEKLQKLMSRSGYHSLLGWLYIDAGELVKAKDAFRPAIENFPSAVDAYAGYALIALLQGNTSEATRMIKFAQLAGGRSPRLEMVKGDLAFHLGEINQAHEYWIESVRQYLWTSSMVNYYPVVYNRAFISIDFPPQMIQPDLPPTLADGFQQALNDGSDLVRAEATKLLPWFENQIHLRTE